MNFTFRIIRLGTTNKRCQFFTFVKNNEELSEASKFLQNERNKQSPDLKRLKTRYENIRDKYGARINFFKPEGRDYDLVYALHAGAKKQGYLQLNKLRWYCIRLSEHCVLFGNGGIKEVQKTQDNPHLKEKEADMRWVDQCISQAMKEGDFEVDANGNIYGTMNFDEEVLINYDLR